MTERMEAQIDANGTEYPVLTGIGTAVGVKHRPATLEKRHSSGGVP
jgi:hypothetical protein